MLKCENHCPKCDSEDIEWSAKDIQDNPIYQNAECLSCGCLFTEIWQYHHTEIDEPEDKEDKCETCKKLGNVNCGNDILHYRCFERKSK